MGINEAKKKYDEIANKLKNDYYSVKSEFEFFEDLLRINKMEKEAYEYMQITMKEWNIYPSTTSG